MKDMDVRVDIDRNTGTYDSYRRWTVVTDEEFESEEREILLEEAQKNRSGD